MKALPKIQKTALILSVLLLIGSAAAVTPQPQKALNSDSPNIKTTEGEVKDGLFDGIDFSFLLSSISGTDQVSPGSNITFDIAAEAQSTFNLEDKVKVVEIYKCQDSTCDNGDFVEAQSGFIGFGVDISQGTDYGWQTTYTTPASPEGYYEATAYISDGNGNILTDTPTHKFIVGSVPNDEEIDEENTDDGKSDSTNEPNVVQNQKPSLTYEDGVATVQVSFKNNGGDMNQEDIVEMQIRPSGQGPLSFGSLSFGESQRVCDESNPYAVHKTFQLDAGEVSTTTLQVEGIEESGSYDVFLLTRDACFPDNEKVDPYFNSVRAGTIDFESGEGIVEIADNNTIILMIVGLLIIIVGGVVWILD